MSKNQNAIISNRIQGQIKKRSESFNGKKNFLSIGSLTKRRRIQLHLTQSQACSSICSVSYLSKIESNKIIPNDAYLDMLMERLNIERYELYMLKNADEVMDKVLEYFYNFDLEGYSELYELCKEYDDNQVAEVVKMGYYLLTEDGEEASSYMMNNINLLNTMTDSVFMTFVLFSCETMLLNNEFDEINAIANDLEALEYNSKFEILCKDFRFRLYAKENREILVGELYHELKLFYSQNVFVKRIERLSEYYFRVLFNAGEYDFIASSSYLTTLSHEYVSLDEYNYILGVSYFKTGRDYGGSEYIKKIKKDSIYYYKALEYLYYCAEDREEFVKEIRTLNKTVSNFYIDYFLAVFLGEMPKNPFTGKEYTDAIKKADISERIRIYHLERDYLTVNFRYKDAILVQRKIEALIAKTKSEKVISIYNNRSKL